jgi:hypothetical protein
VQLWRDRCGSRIEWRSDQAAAVESARRWPGRRGGGVVGSLTASVAVAIQRVDNSNLVLQRGRRSKVDGRQGDAIPISDQVK